MLEVIVLCEGQTEREFCREVVAPELLNLGIALAGTLVGKPQRKRGGIRDWTVYKRELLRLAKERNDRHVALLVDYYGMPTSWPGRASSNLLPKEKRGTSVEDALKQDLAADLGGRFHPCVQLHEFESLLFVDPQIACLSIAIGGGMTSHQPAAEMMSAAKVECGGSVEQIDDDPEKAPSRRLIRIIPGYDKIAWGITALKDVAFPTLRSGCPWLDRWLTALAMQCNA